MKIRNLLVAVSLAGFASAAAAATDVITATDQKIATKSVIAASVSASRAGSASIKPTHRHEAGQDYWQCRRKGW